MKVSPNNRINTDCKYVVTLRYTLYLRQVMYGVTDVYHLPAHVNI